MARRRLRLHVFALALAAMLCVPAAAQTKMTPAETGRRSAPDFAPAHAGERVVVRGVVSAPPYFFPTYTLLGFEDADGGAVVQCPPNDRTLAGLHAGDQIEAVGVIEALAGMPVIKASAVKLLGHAPAPAPISLSARQLTAFPSNLRYMGRLVRVEGRAGDVSDTTAGGQILVGPATQPVKIFVPSASGMPDLRRFETDDVVTAVGVALQFCPAPPYNRFFEVLVNDEDLIGATRTGWPLPPTTLALGLTAILFVSFILWTRERRLRKQRERLRQTFHLGEEILSASSAAAVLKRISEALPGILGVTRVHLFLHNRAAKTLDSAPGTEGEPISIPLASSAPGSIGAGAVACFHYRTLLAIPDTSRSPFPFSARDRAAPKSALFLPMLAQSEVMGVLELDQDNRTHDFSLDEQALAQHLANQIAVAIRLLDQRTVQEQLFRTEKLAAVGRLISGVVDELRAPLASISELAATAMPLQRNGGREIAAIAAQAERAATIVARLVAAGADTAVARPVCVSTLLRSLIQFREADWRASGIQVQDLVSREHLNVLGSQGQLEQVFLTLIVHSEQALAEATEKTLSIRTVVLGKRLLVEICSCPGAKPASRDETAMVLALTRGIITGHGGEVRVVDAKEGQMCFEVELPALGPDRGSAPAVSHGWQRRMTALLIEPDEAVQRQLMTILASRNCRVVPVASADAGLELANRMRFDLAFCSVRAPGLNWVELSERMQERVIGFILLSDHYDAELQADFEGEGRFVVAKPIQEPDLERALEAVLARSTA